jgi:proteasome assembly chaperone (PAC2) family protein
VALYRLVESVKLETPTLIAAFDGWVDAGSAGTLAAQRLIAESRIVATFDADRLFDYRARRPTLDILDGTLQELEWPELHLRATKMANRDLLILTGPEPDFRWHELSSDVTELARDLGVSNWVSIGSIPAAVAHTRPVPVLGTASVRGLLPEGVAQGPEGRLRVPSAVLSVLELGVSQGGVPSVGFYAQVPHYLSAAYPQAAIELLTHVGRYLDFEPPLGDLPMQALETRALLDAATAADERTKAHVERLEEMADQARLPAGDELIADIERFLRDRGGGDRGDGGTRLN